MDMVLIHKASCKCFATTRNDEGTVSVACLISQSMLALFYVWIFVVTAWVPFVYWHWALYGVVNVYQLSLSLFGAINLLICIWEMILFFHISTIVEKYQNKLKKLEKGELGTIFLFEHMDLSTALKPITWTDVWATYSLVDESYSKSTSFGWNIDIGNGFSTFVPTILVSFGMTLQHELFSPKTLGLLGALSYYQELYGTVVYFTQYIVNKRWLKHNNSWTQILLLVVCSNIVWFVFPLLGLYLSTQLIFQDSFDILVY